MHSSSSYLKFYSAQNWVIIENHLYEVEDLFEVKEQKKKLFPLSIKTKKLERLSEKHDNGKTKHLFYLNLSKKKAWIMYMAN